MKNKKTKILLCSLLKPADDVRQYRKLAITLAKIPNTNVVSVGSLSNTKVANEPNIWLIPAFSYQRGLVFRFLNFFKMFKILLQQKPEVIIVNSADLLLVAIAYKILFGSVLCYDVQENYLLNLKHSKSWSVFLRYPLALAVRVAEWVSAPFISQYFLAEAVYAKQLPFLSPTRTLILENKFQPYPNWETDKLSIIRQENLYLISGTLGPSYLILESIAWFLDHILPTTTNAELIIAGYAPDKNYLKEIESTVNANPSIRLIGGEKLVPFEAIIRLQLKAQYGIINLANTPAMVGKIATKAFEYQANSLIIIDLGISKAITKKYLVKNFSNTNLWQSNTKYLVNTLSNVMLKY